MTEPPRPFHILTVCTGNICRSPIIERLLAARLREHCGARPEDVVVTSAGTWGHEGAPMEEYAATRLIELGGDPTGFTARELDADMVARADLVLAATREHRAAAVTLRPVAVRRCFTLLEFSRLLGPLSEADLPDGPLALRLRGLVEAAAANRGLVPAAQPSDDDVEDPYGAPELVFARVAGVIDEALRRPVALLAATAAQH